MSDAQFIVNKLNEPPFKYDLSLLELTQKSPQGLLQLLSDVFGTISPRHQKIDVAQENADQTADRLITFLKIVKYKPTVDSQTFRQLLAAGDKDVVYPVLRWVLPQPKILEQRAFVGHYLSLPDLPDDLNYDPDVMELKDRIKELQQDFIDVHKRSSEVKKVTSDSTALKAKIKDLEEEKERLTEKVASAKSRVSLVPDKDRYLEACSALRKEHDREVDLSTQLQEQKQLAEKAQATYLKSSARVRELQAGMQEGVSAQKLLETLQEDVKNMRFQVNEQMPKELERKERRLQALQEALTNGNSEADIQALHKQVQELQAKINDLNQQKLQKENENKTNKAFLQLRQAQQMAAMVAKKKDEIQAKLERLQEKKAALTAQYEKRAAADGSSGGVVSDEEWKEKFEAMKAKLPQYKKYKKELGDIEAEVFVLQHTEEVLAGKEEEINERVKKLERKQGVSGFVEKVTELEKVSEQKSAIDEEKGMTLQEISRTVEEINTAIKDRKNKLAPQIKKLRNMRQQFQELETDYNEKKSTFDSAKLAADSKTSVLDAEVTALKTEILENEQKYHLLNCQLHNTDVYIKKVTTGQTAERLKEKFQAKVKEQDDAQRSLKDAQKRIKDTHTTGLSQIDMMTDLVKLLNLKLQLQGSSSPSTNAPTQFDTATANVMVL